jgi:hypothetical protein
MALTNNWFKGKWCVENVISYYKPLIPPTESNSHYFWTNFYFKPLPNMKRGIRRQEHDFRLGKVAFDLEELGLPKVFEKQIINNCVEPEIGAWILECAKNLVISFFIKAFEQIFHEVGQVGNVFILQFLNFV